MMTARFFDFIILLLFLGICSDDSYAGTFTWDDGGADKDWMNPLNWDANDIAVPSPTDDVIIPADYFVLLNSTTTIQSLTLMGTLTIEKPVQLNVFGGVPNGVNVSGGNLIVEGILNVGLTDVHGIELAALGVMLVNGRIIIDDAGDSGIHIKVNSRLDINSEAQVDILDVRTGINCAFGTVNNQGVVDVSDNNGLNGAGVTCGGSGIFNNLSAGNIFVSNFQAASLASGVINYGEFNNMGMIDIQEFSRRGIDNLSGLFSNEGTIDVHDSDGTGVYNDLQGLFENKLGGTIKIRELGGTQFSDKCMEIKGEQFVNHGRIELRDYTGSGIINSSIMGFINHGELIFSTEESSTPISNSSTFTNEETGSIFVNLDSTFQIISNTALFENHGSLQVDAYKLNWFLLSSTSGSELINTGIMNIEVGGGGVECGMLLSDTSVDNSGSITLNFNKFFDAGIELINNSTFLNQANGAIEFASGSASTGIPLLIELGSSIEDRGETVIR